MLGLLEGVELPGNVRVTFGEHLISHRDRNCRLIIAIHHSTDLAESSSDLPRIIATLEAMSKSRALERIYFQVNMWKFALPANEGWGIDILFYLKMRFLRPHRWPHWFGEIRSRTLPFILVKYRGHWWMLELESELILDPPRPNSLAVLFQIALVLFWSD
jgi:hypothetical protein